MENQDSLSPVLSGDESTVLGNKVPVVTIEDDKGQTYTFIPIATVMDTNQLLVQLLEQTAVEITIQPGLTPNPNPEHVAFVKNALEEQSNAGLISKENLAKLDPVFQAKYELNYQNLVSSIVSGAAEKLIKHYQGLNLVKRPGDIGYGGGSIITGR